MFYESDIRAATKAQGLRTKKKNLLAAVFSGAVLIAISVRWIPPTLTGILAGLVAGLVYANGFEYVLHRCACSRRASHVIALRRTSTRLRCGRLAVTL